MQNRIGGNRLSHKRFLYLLCTIMLLAGCGIKETVDNSVNKDENYTQIVEPNNKLGFSLLENLDHDSDNNIFISPTSALIALSMALNGAEGETKEEMKQALALQGLSLEEINGATKSLMSLLEKEEDAIKLSFANSIWLNENFQFTDEYTKNLSNYYEAQLTEIDVNKVESVDKINNWVREATNDKITEIAEAPLNPYLVAMLINAVYFKGDWQYEFNEQLTEDLPFYTDDSEMNVPMMMLEEDLMYLETDHFQAVKLPYGKGEMSMNVFLPSENSSLEDLLKKFSVDNWELWKTQFEEMNGTVKFPKFQLEYEAELNEALQQLGMEKAFKRELANFSKMIYGDDPLWIDVVKQKTFIDVNEEGTEAAAVTSVELETMSLVIEDSFYMEVNRPFFFMITDDETDVILFMGLISTPLQQ